MNKKTKPELLAPAGDLERLKIAILYGADAVYVGGTSFSLRANAINFTLDDLKEGVAFAHERNKKVYVTVNIILHDQELQEMVDYLIQLDELEVDAIIISDPAIIPLVKQYTSLQLHLSTQQSTLNQEAVSFWKTQGISRIVLGREVLKEDIKKIATDTTVELECFIHGAICAAYSGRCVLSNFLTARDANRGGCSQVCRWNFDLYANDTHQTGEREFTFCMKDLSMLPHIKELIELEICSFKIEGRMRSIYYIGTVVETYRKAIDECWNQETDFTYNSDYERVLKRVANRDSIVHFFGKDAGSECQYYNGRQEVSNQDFLGIILEYDHINKLATIEQRNYFKVGDTVDIFGLGKEIITFLVLEIYDEDGNSIDIVRHPRQVVKIPVEKEVFKNQFLRINIE